MSVERTDVRFMLPRPPRTVALLGHLADTADAFALVGVEVVAGRADLVLAPAALAREAAASANLAAVVEGRGGTGRRLLAMPDTLRPAVVVPLDRRGPLGYAVRHFAGRATRAKALRNRIAPPLLARGLVPASRALAVDVREAGPPWLIAAAGLPHASGFFWVPGASDLLSRGALFVFAPGASAPEWIIKFGRVPGAVAAFDRDAAGLGIAARAGVAHAPRLLARLDAHGLPAAVETVARGERLQALLASSAPRAAKVAAVERVAAWIVDVGRETASGAPVLELERLRRDVLPPWGAAPDLLDGLERTPAVLQHNDLGTWNLLVDGTGFTAVDWESARPAGLPLWDLVYFLSYAILGLDGVEGAGEEAHLMDVYRGEAPSSALLFRWLGHAVSALSLDAAVVGRLAVTCWLHHGLSHVARDAAVRAVGGEPAVAATALPRRLAQRWLHELGPEWDYWRTRNVSRA